MIGWQVLITEIIKLRRTRIIWLTWLATSIMPLADAMFVWVVKSPERAANFGLIGTKAEVAGVTADWSGFFALLRQTEVGGLVLAAVIAAYVFGREYAEGTAKNMLTLPVARHWFVAAKLAVVALWFAVLTVWLAVEGLLIASLLDLPGYSRGLVVSALSGLALLALVIWMLTPIVSWIALLGRGYMAPLGFTIFMLVMANVVDVVGWGKWFPWSIVTTMAGVIGAPSEAPGPASITVLAIAFLAGVLATTLQLRYADNTQ